MEAKAYLVRPDYRPLWGCQARQDGGLGHDIGCGSEEKLIDLTNIKKVELIRFGIWRDIWRVGEELFTELGTILGGQSLEGRMMSSVKTSRISSTWESSK